MDLKSMRRSCAALVRDLDLPLPAEPEQVLAALCARMEQRQGKPVHHRLVAFPPNTVSGLWMATDDAHYILCEAHTSPWHQLLITCHEFWHMEADHQATGPTAADIQRRLGPSVDAVGHTEVDPAARTGPADRTDPKRSTEGAGRAAVTRILAGRTHCDAEEEQEADFFASLLMARVSRWLPAETWRAPESGSASEVVRRLETTLGRRPDRRAP
ncbi:hypothetical protein [Streptomyces oceani]|uniref:hypothetical protein n=1 Tax=Streptomyces oceani TaxID=1075402 RepID=UPI000872DF42|nr:hypothetical protein [Streptomyces oceani]